MTGDARAGVRIREADVRPRLAGVRRLVDAIPGLDVAADAPLAHADEDDVRIGLRHGDRADRRAVDLAVGDVGPRLAAVGGLPKAAASLARVHHTRLALHAADRDRPARVIGTDASPAKPLRDDGV